MAKHRFDELDAVGRIRRAAEGIWELQVVETLFARFLFDHLRFYLDSLRASQLPDTFYRNGNSGRKVRLRGMMLNRFMERVTGESGRHLAYIRDDVGGWIGFVPESSLRGGYVVPTDFFNTNEAKMYAYLLGFSYQRFVQFRTALDHPKKSSAR